jgi:hypothetical protein
MLHIRYKSNLLESCLNYCTNSDLVPLSNTIWDTNNSFCLWVTNPDYTVVHSIEPITDDSYRVQDVIASIKREIITFHKEMEFPKQDMDPLYNSDIVDMHKFQSSQFRMNRYNAMFGMKRQRSQNFDITKHIPLKLWELANQNLNLLNIQNQHDISMYLSFMTKNTCIAVKVASNINNQGIQYYNCVIEACKYSNETKGG